MVANLQERYWSKFGYPELCPILFADPVGLIVIMPRCKRTGAELCPVHYTYWAEYRHLPVDNNRGNFGYLGERLVLFDYGT